MKVPDGKATRDTIFNVRFGSFADSLCQQTSSTPRA